MTAALNLRGNDDSGQSITFDNHSRPYDDDIVRFDVLLQGKGISVTQSVTSGEEYGQLLPPHDVSNGGIPMPVRLSELMRDLSSGPQWDGQRTWRSLQDELAISFSIDDFGHVSIEFRVAPATSKPTWSAACTLRYNLGDLARIADEVAGWFSEHPKPPPPSTDRLRPV